MFKKLVASIVFVASSLFGVSAIAAAPPAIDFTPITSVVSYDSVGTAILAIAVILATLYVTWAGAKIILKMVKGAA